MHGQLTASTSASVAASKSGIPYDLVYAYKNSKYFQETTHAKQEAGKVIPHRAYQFTTTSLSPARARSLSLSLSLSLSGLKAAMSRYHPTMKEM